MPKTVDLVNRIRDERPEAGTGASYEVTGSTAVDIDIFLVSRIRESYLHGECPRQAVVSGFRSSARVVTAAALIMTAVFSGFLGPVGRPGLAPAILARPDRAPHRRGRSGAAP